MELALKVAALLLLCGSVISDNDECTTEGSFPVPGSPEKFSLCMKTKGKWNKITLACPKGMLYSEEETECIASVVNKHTYPFVHNKSNTCLYNGLYCTDCRTMRVCVRNSYNNRFIHIKDVTCPEGTTCSTYHQQCVPDIRCPMREFQCTDFGVFPDPYDCTKLHACFNYHHLPSECPVGQVFDTQSGKCSRNGKCTRFPDCQRVFETHALDDTKMFYICTNDEKNNTIAPEFYNCPEGLTFDEKSYQCSLAV